MRRALAVALKATAAGSLLAVTAFSAAAPAGASTNYLARAAGSLNHGQLVFVAADTPGYNVDQTQVQSPGNPIALVELPATATVETGGSAQQFADELDALTGHRYIIGVAFVAGTPPNTSDTFVTATTRIPQAQSDKQMSAAENVGQGPEDTLNQFGYFMSTWLQSNPSALRPVAQPTSSSGHTVGSAGQPEPSHHGGGFSALLLLILVPIAACAVYVLLVRPRQQAKTIPGLLRQLEALEGQIGSSAVQRSLASIRGHTDRYLIRVQENFSEDELVATKRTALFNLQRVYKVAQGYLDMEQHPDEWPGDTDARLEATAASLDKFDRDLQAAIQQANEGTLAAMQVDTSVLENSAI